MERQMTVDIDRIASAFQDGFTNGNAQWAQTPEHHKEMFREGIRCAMNLPQFQPRAGSSEPMADGGDRPMSAAEEVLAWLLVEKIGAPDDVPYSPDQAQEIIVRHLDRAKELDQIADMLAEGQGDDSGPPILPEFVKGSSVYAKVEACLHLLERRRDALTPVNPTGDALEKADAICSQLDIASTDDRLIVLSGSFLEERERCALILESMLINTDANAVERARSRHYAKMIRDGSSPSIGRCGLPDPSARDCANMKEVGGGMDGERYHCSVCGKGYYLDYDEMK